MPAVRQTFVVIDEAWALLSNLGGGASAPGVVEAVQGIRRRQRGRFASGDGPTFGSGASDSEQVALAKGLLADSETRCDLRPSRRWNWPWRRICSPSRRREASLLPQLRRGVALWKVGQGSYLVQHRLSNLERTLVKHRWCHGGRRECAGSFLTALVPLAAAAHSSRWLLPARPSPCRGPADGQHAAPAGAAERELKALLLDDRAAHPGRLALGTVPRCSCWPALIAA